jgi:AraC-like DNA-binding protein
MENMSPVDREDVPSPLFQEGIRSMSVLAELHSADTEEHWVPPDDRVDLVFYHGDAWLERQDGRLQALPPVFVSGLRTEPVRIISRGMTHLVSARLDPWCARLLLDLEESPSGFCTPVGSELGALSKRVGRFLEVGAHQPALELVEGWLLKRATPQREPMSRSVEVAGLELQATHGAARIGTIATRLGLSLRQLERRFHEAVGLSPKALARLIRFARASERLDLDPGMSLTSLAFELGYADQPHFIREFRAFAGMTPGQYASEAPRPSPPPRISRAG